MVLTLGIINFLLIVFQLSTGLRWIKTPFVWHKRGAIALSVSAVIHAVFALLV